MKKLFWHVAGFIALVLALILFLEMAFASQEEANRIEFFETVAGVEAKAQTYAVLKLSALEVVFKGLDTVQTVALGVDVSDQYIGQTGLGIVRENRFSVALPDGNRFSVYIIDGLENHMEVRFPVYIEQ